MARLSRREFLKGGIAGGACAALGGRAFAAEAGSRPNVLFIAVDDLRPDIGCFGSAMAHTPNIDELASRGTVFRRAYCQQAVCNASRVSLLTGLRPDTTRIYDLQTHIRYTLPDVVTLPQHFKQHGYFSQGLGKIFHGGLDDPDSWSVPHWDPGGPGYGSPETIAAIRRQAEQLRAEGRNLEVRVIERDPRTGQPLKVAQPRFRARGPAWEAPDVADNALPDGKTADRAAQALREAKGRTFFLACGFVKPHLPFVAPRKYFDFHPMHKIHLPDNYAPTKDAPAIALTDWGELRSYSDMPKQGPLTELQARQLIRAYHAAASYTDAQIGKVLRELRRLGLEENTIVVLWGDHGWHLGDQSLWCKHTNFEVADRAPLIISAPGQRNAGACTDALSEFVDIYPTLCDLAGLTVPDGLEGTSLKPVMDAPERAWKAAAFSQYPRREAMGYSMTTPRYRYTEWLEPGKEPLGVELYDHVVDPGETANLAAHPEKRVLAAGLSKRLKAGWRAALPRGVRAV